MIEPEPNGIYLIELCSGEYRRWRFRGFDSGSQTWWCDLETGREFSESGVMYSWQIVGQEDPPTET